MTFARSQKIHFLSFFPQFHTPKDFLPAKSYPSDTLWSHNICAFVMMQKYSIKRNAIQGNFPAFTGKFSENFMNFPEKIEFLSCRLPQAGTCFPSISVCAFFQNSFCRQPAYSPLPGNVLHLILYKDFPSFYTKNSRKRKQSKPKVPIRTSALLLLPSKIKTNRGLKL